METMEISRNNRDFMSLTDDEIRQVVNDIFQPKKITCIRRHKRDDEITCKIYTEWEGDKDIGEDDFVIADELTLMDPFTYGVDAIHIDMSVGPEDYRILKQFCFAKGIRPTWIIDDNPYLKDKKE